MRRGLGLLFCTAVLLGCSGGGGGTSGSTGSTGSTGSSGSSGSSGSTGSVGTRAIIWSCDMPPATASNDHQCQDYVGSAWADTADRDQSKQQCNSVPGDSASDSPCATDGVVGSCDYNYDSESLEYYIRYYAPTTVEQAQNYCSIAGGHYFAN